MNYYGRESLQKREFRVKKDKFFQPHCYGLDCVPSPHTATLTFVCGSRNPHYFRIRLNLKIESLKRKLNQSTWHPLEGKLETQRDQGCA